MNEKIKAVEMVRGIRDGQQRMLAGKSADEVRPSTTRELQDSTQKLRRFLKNQTRNLHHDRQGYLDSWDGEPFELSRTPTNYYELSKK